MAKKSLTKIDWVHAGFRALTKGGPRLVNAEHIARTLKVSKGSFYWHFADVPALKREMIGHWRRVATDDVITLLDQREGSARDRLVELVQMGTAELSTPFGGHLVDAAIRDWARYEPFIKKALREVDRARLDYGAKLFAECGFDSATAREKSISFYGALVGLAQLSYLDEIAYGQTLTRVLEDLLASD